MTVRILCICLASKGGVSVRQNEMLKTIFYLVIIVAGMIYIVEKVIEALG